MKRIVISNLLKEKLDFNIGVILFNANVFNNQALDKVINDLEKEIKNNYDLKDVLDISNIKSGRDAYKILRKDPSRYRLAVESLYRRVVKGNSLYRINNVVDIGNVLSLKTQYSTAVLDYEKIVGDIIIRIGKDELYEGIGRGMINVENIPIYCDDIGPFGSTTSDTKRTMITDDTKKILVFIVSFNGKKDLLKDINIGIYLYKKYANGTDFKYTII